VECGRTDVRVSRYRGLFCSRCSERKRLRGEQPKEPRPLTERQREVFRCLARGLSYQEAADELGMSLFTVQKHVSHGLRRRNVMTREEVYAAEGWLRINGDAA
jgi:DNA-binding NarL/FixJ family response regulator